MLKFISEKEYQAFQAFKDNKDARPSKDEVVKLEAKIKGLLLDIETSARELVNIKEDHRIAIERKNESIQSEVEKAIRAKQVENDSLKIENSNNKKEVEILNKAFENLGFDVKDMKQILNKLVDGIVSKNTIQLVK